MDAVNREFVYIDFDDERFLPAKMVASACSMVALACVNGGGSEIGPPIPVKSAETILFLQHFRASRNSEADPPDPPFEAFEAETQHLVPNRPWVPHAPGVRITVVYTSSLKS